MFLNHGILSYLEDYSREGDRLENSEDDSPQQPTQTLTTSVHPLQKAQRNESESLEPMDFFRILLRDLLLRWEPPPELPWFCKSLEGLGLGGSDAPAKTSLRQVIWKQMLLLLM